MPETSKQRIQRRAREEKSDRDEIRDFVRRNGRGSPSFQAAAAKQAAKCAPTRTPRDTLTNRRGG